MTDFSRNCIARYTWKGLNPAGDFENRMNPGVGDLTPDGAWVGDDSELVDTDLGQGIYITPGVMTRFNGGPGAFAGFTVQPFSFEFYVHTINVAVSQQLIMKSDNATVGYIGYIAGTGRLTFITYGGGATIVTNSVVLFPIQRLVPIVIARLGDRVRFYVDGIEVNYNLIGVHNNLASAAANDFEVYGHGVANLRGYGGPVRVWDGRTLSTANAWELKQLGPNRT